MWVEGGVTWQCWAWYLHTWASSKPYLVTDVTLLPWI
jgi:hypothetical protein